MTLALSSEQIEILHGAADAVPPKWRSRFIASVADLLTMTPEQPSNRDVINAVNNARRAMAIGSGPGAYARRGIST